MGARPATEVLRREGVRDVPGARERRLELAREPAASPTALVFDIKRDCSEDGPGVRTSVFFKGCPLACVWCQNPEGLAREPELSWRAERCHPAVCGAPCVPTCPAGALRRDNGGLAVERDRCTRCDRCFEQCRMRALEPVGFRIGVDELVYRVCVDRPFYRATGGGVTLTGGEPTLQMDFVALFLRRLKEEGIDTALETCGFFHYAAFRTRLLPWLDRVYFDVKLIDEDEHRRWTGQSNRPILANLSRLAREADIPVHVRVPLIPGITTTRANLSGIATFLLDHGLTSATLMPYNPLWHDKLDRLGKEPRYCHRHFVPQEQLQAWARMFSPATG